MAVELRYAGARADVSFRGVLRDTWSMPVVAIPARNYRGNDPVTSLACLIDGRMASGHGSGAIRLLNCISGKIEATLERHTNAVTSLVVLPDNVLASAIADHSVRLWNLSTNTCIAALKGHTDKVEGLALLHDKRLVSGSNDGTIRFWNTNTHKCLKTIKPGLGNIGRIIALPSGEFAYLSQGGIPVFTSAGVLDTILTRPEYRGIFSLSLLVDGRLAVAYGPRETPVIAIWDLQKRVVDIELRGHVERVSALLPLADGRLLSGSRDNTIKVWGQHALSQHGGARVDAADMTMEGHAGEVYALVQHSDGRVLSGSFDGTIRVWQ